MKKIFSFFVLLVGMAQLTACSDNETTNPYAHQSTITVEKAEVTFDANGGIGSVQVSSPSAVSVSIPAEFQWLKASVAGNAINVSVDPNPNIDGRSAQLTIKNISDEVTVTVSQKGLVSRLSSYQMVFSDEKSVQALAFDHDVPVNVQSLDDWIVVQVDDENSRLLVGVASNDVETARVGYVAISSGNVKDTLAVLQTGFVFNIEKSSISVTDVGGDETIAIQHSRPVTVEADVDWIACELDETGDAILVSVSKNLDEDRQGTITVKSLDYTKTITVTQKGPEQGTEPQEENTLLGTYTFYWIGSNTYNLGNLTIEEDTDENAEEGDVVIKGLYIEDSEIYGYYIEDKLYIYANQKLGVLNDPDEGDYGNLIMSASKQNLIEFDITPDGIVSTDFCVMATNPEYTQGWWWEIPAGGTTMFVKAEAAARATHRAAAKFRIKADRSRKNLPISFKLYYK